MERRAGHGGVTPADVSCPVEGGGRPGEGQWVPGHLAVLYFFVFWSQFKPSEPFLVDYLVDSKGFTNHEVFQQVFCLYVYARMPFNALVGVFSELPGCGAGGVLVVGAACGLVTALLTRFTAALWCQQAAQFTVAAAFASRYATIAVAFALTPPAHFQRSIHTVRAVLLFSNCCSALLGEVLRDSAGVPLSVLFDIDLVSQTLTLLSAAVLVLAGMAARRRAPPPSEAPRSREWVSVAEVAEAAVAPPAPRAVSSWLARAKAPAKDLWMYFQLRRILWWTVWAIAMNTAHGIVLTYWQNLLREKGIHNDHNGYLSASMYFAAAVLTAASRRSPLLRGHTSALIVGTMLTAAFLLCMVVASTQQFAFYCWLLLFQCLFEVMTAVATFQVGSEVSEFCSVGASYISDVSWDTANTSKDSHRIQVGRACPPSSPRLTLLLSVTGIFCGTTETIVQAAVGSTWKSMGPRFLCLGIGLGGIALLLVVARGLEEVANWRRRTRRRRSSSGRLQDAQAANGIVGAIPQVPLLPS